MNNFVEMTHTHILLRSFPQVYTACRLQFRLNVAYVFAVNTFWLSYTQTGLLWDFETIHAWRTIYCGKPTEYTRDVQTLTELQSVVLLSMI